MVLMDTCAWIDFFKSRTGELGNKVADLIELNQAAITGVVIAELFLISKLQFGNAYCQAPLGVS